MSSEVQRVYPSASAPRPLTNLYLEHRLHELGSTQAPYVFGSFVSSLDGRIAVNEPQSGGKEALEGLTSPADFRLFQEIQAQADCLITHGGYLRALAEARLGNVLQINASGRAADLVEWRTRNGLSPQPAVVIVSASLDFAVHASIAEHRQPLYIATGRSADASRVEALQERGHQVIFAGDGTMVEGAPLVRALGGLGYKSLYLLAGPKMLETMLRDRMLARLYLTIRHRLLGGEHFSTLIQGPRLGDAGEFTLRALYNDNTGGTESGQWFAHFDCIRP
jgi:riboflavin biosynthesis pyrimidine reductase